MSSSSTAHDLSFAAFNARQRHEISPGAISERSLAARPAGHFKFGSISRSWETVSYSGFAVISMLNDHPENGRLSKALTAIQRQLSEGFSLNEALYLLDPESFHQTIANTLSAERFQRYILEPGLEGSYPDLMARVFDEIKTKNQDTVHDTPIEIEMIGLGLFGTAIAMLGTVKDEEHYARIMRFRRSFYSNASLKSLDIKMTRPFIAHITLAYLELDLDSGTGERENLARVINKINFDLRATHESSVFFVQKTGLMRYQDLSAFYRLPDYPFYFL